MKNKSFTFTLRNSLRNKLINDTINNGFSSISAYINELIKKGLPVDEPIDLRLKLVEKKLDSLTDNVFAHNKRTYSLLEKLFKKFAVVYKIAAHILARTFFIKPGNISQDDFVQTKAFIEEQVKRIEESNGSD